MSLSDMPPEFRHADAPDAGPETPAPRRRPAWWVALPALALVAAGLAWTGAWYYAAGRAEREIDNWIVAEGARGRDWSCGNRTIGGYPFRFELSCDGPSVVLQGPTQWTWKAARVHAVAQVWNPRHIIAEFTGPATLSEAATGRTITAGWTLLQVSGAGTGQRLERFSLAANDYTLAEGGATILSARHLELHLRQHPGEAANGALDIAMEVDDATGMALMGGAPAAGAQPAAPVDALLQATITGVPELAILPVEARLLKWQANGGRVKIDQARISAGGGMMAAMGELGLDPQRRLDGMVTVSVVEAGKLLPVLASAGLMPDFLTALAPVLGAAGMPTQVDGANASAFPFVFRNGRVALGILPLGKIGPVF
ncbi:DUF2125 domain-containing protein [Ancylobacter sp. A5.8]|uniref:DUF2125 domain-containing protein n=1 Tax=Ancylobacter gelatini TaxID=2919920 RepID=UPI001F4E4AF4|nr:DUF2125 domain-containing protein [Ancylobacter gelatini]MCJ8144355.1 DUF2125 domain-containing protein [Ancylobacter gelatini]